MYYSVVQCYNNLKRKMEHAIALAMGLAIKTFVETILFQSDSGSESDEEIIGHCSYKRICAEAYKQKPNRIQKFVERTIPMYNDTQFQSHFRLTRETFNRLLQLIAPSLSNLSDKGGRPTVNPQKQLLAVMWLLANNESYRSVGDRFDMGKSTLSHCFTRVVQKLNEISSIIIRWPDGVRLEEVKEGFYRFGRIPNIVGAVDGTYVKIKAPKEFPENYINRKCFYGITLQAVCDHKLKFTNCFAGYPSSVSDGRIFRNSDVYHKIVNNKVDYFPNGEYILGDKAYPLTDWCIPPYIERRALTDIEVFFNKQHAKSRQCIERAFALLFGRFRRLRDLNMNRLDWIPATIIACCVLQNISLDFRDIELENYIAEGQFIIDERNRIRFGNEEHEEVAIQKRDQIARDVFNRI